MPPVPPTPTPLPARPVVPPTPTPPPARPSGRSLEEELKSQFDPTVQELEKGLRHHPPSGSR
ncbi:hypothetical protein E4P82_16635 [Candidatus Competibacter phosphatis]|uniref:Uncharacterized protein n=1 Tax=Candidatus Competibacter phosphatis TaxID=221280 RepID=A0ABX1TQL1_9GAMM|nr:hypothetical protein [Candidatus Competibacter phosphatis]